MSTQDTESKQGADSTQDAGAPAADTQAPSADALPAKGAPASSTLDELPESARHQEMMRLRQEEESAAGVAASTMEELTNTSQPTGERTPLKSRPEPEVRRPPSALERLIRLDARETDSASRADSSPARRPGDPSTTAPRMALRGEGAGIAEAARLESLLTFSGLQSTGRTDDKPRGTSSLDGLIGVRGGPVDLGLSGAGRERGSSLSGADLHIGGGPMRLQQGEDPTRLNMSNDLSRLVDDQPLPRARLPRRTTAGVVPEPDGFTAIPLSRVPIRCELAAHQRCPGRAAPVEVGERQHHRVEFRYNRFELLEVTQVLYECPGVADMEPFAGASPAFFAAHAPIGDGMLAQIILAMFRDGMLMSQVETLLAQLDTSIPGSILRAQLIETADALMPVVAKIRAEQSKPTTDTPVPVLHAGLTRDSIGHILVHSDKSSVVVEYHEGSPDTFAEQGIGVRLRDTARGKGRAARWGVLRQKFLSALVTDNTRARTALRLLDQLPALPDATHADALDRLKRWLDREWRDIAVPRSRLEHAISTGISLWPLLLDDGPRPHGRPLVAEWSFSPDSIPPAQTMCFHSILETCARLHIAPWDYLMALMNRLGGPDQEAAALTPAAWRNSHG